MASRKIQSLAAVVGANIVRLRKRAGMTQEELAERLNVSGASLSRIENGLAAPRFSRLEELATILGCHVADLFRREGDPLHVSLDTLEDMLRPLPAEAQEDLIYLMTVAIQTVKKAQGTP